MSSLPQRLTVLFVKEWQFLGEEVEFDVTGAGTSGGQEHSEMSSLTEFMKHQATD